MSRSESSDISQNPTTPKHHPEYYFDDGNIIFLVENVLFCVHRHFLVRDSVVFRDMLSVPTGGIDKTPEGLSDESPIVVHTVKSIDFERMLWMFYNKSYVDYKVSAETWSSILSLAHMWEFETMARVAFKAYDALSDVDPVDKIAIYQKYGLPRKNLLNEYAKVCTRTKALSVEEGQKIGVETLALIAQTREDLLRRGILSPAHAGDNTVKVIISNRFDLTDPLESCNHQ